MPGEMSSAMEQLGDAASPQEPRAVALVASMARSAEECAELLGMLGLEEPVARATHALLRLGELDRQYPLRPLSAPARGAA